MLETFGGPGFDGGITREMHSLKRQAGRRCTAFWLFIL